MTERTTILQEVGQAFRENGLTAAITALVGGSLAVAATVTRIAFTNEAMLERLDRELHLERERTDKQRAEGQGGGTVGAGSEPVPSSSGSLAARFGIPPFSILDARKGWWQDRKRAWLDMGIRSELGRGEGDRACPGGSPMPGNGSRKDYKPGAAKAFNDGAVLGGGGLADQVAKAATARRQKKEAAHG